jgi:histidyl-tRNA synthetase
MIAAPRGTRDILPADTRIWQRLESSAHSVLQRYGYAEIRTPMFEATEVFARTVGANTDIVSKEMYSFPDRKGRSLALRPEATAAVMRAALQHQILEGSATKRLYYLGPMFRYERMQKGRYRQFSQLGLEALGSEDPAVDVEAIDALLAFIKNLGIEGAELEINAIGDAECRDVFRAKLVSKLEAVADRLCDDCQRRLKENPLRVLDCKRPACIEATADAPTPLDSLCTGCSEHFEQVRAQLEALGHVYRLNPRLVRGLDYYVRTAFELVHGDLGAQNALAGGGRYDGLAEALGGPRVPAVGWAAGLDRLVMTMPAVDERRAGSMLIVLAAEAGPRALKLAARLRERGETVVLEPGVRTLKAGLRQASRNGMARALIIGPDEIERCVVSVKDLETGEQRDVREEEV